MAFNMFASFRGYVFASLLLTTAVISHAVYLKRFFYRSVIYLSKSKFAILAVGNMSLVSVLLMWRLIQAIFLGPLRFREIERLHIRARDAVIECCFAISIFRNEFDEKFVALVMTLLLLKSLHWLSKDRIEFLEEQPLSPVRTHLRLVGLMSVLLLLDLFLVKRFASITLRTQGASMYVLFAFEYTIMVIELLSDLVRYSFLVIDTSMDGHWEEKSMFSFYIELLSDLCQLTVYVLFFIYVQLFYSFPFHIIRELYVTFNKFQRRCSDFLRYRRVVATMNDLFADATEEELDEGDRTCIICREEMQTAKKLACGHIFHARCLQSWLKRQLSCPTCRATIDVNGGGHSRNAQNANRENNPQGNQLNNDANNANNNNINNAGGANANNAVGPRNQGVVNIGEAGFRLLNVANEWWNQVMVDAGVGAVAGAGARQGLPIGANAVGAGGIGADPNGAGRGVAGAAGAAGAAGVAGAAGANVPRGHPQRTNPRHEAPQNNAMAANMFLRGPNAVAHMQLRARRRGAWPHPYQPYQMAPLHYHPNHPHQGHHHEHGIMNPFLPQYRQPMGQNGHPPQLNANANPPDPANTAGMGTSSNIGGGLNANQASEGHLSQGVADGRLSGTTATDERSPVSQVGGSSNDSSSVLDGQAPSSSSTGQGRISLNGENEPSHGSMSNPSSSSTGAPAGPGGFRQSEVASGVQGYSQGIPLERLLSIQEQIEALRSEVMDLILIATSDPPHPIEPQREVTGMSQRPVLVNAGPSEPQISSDISPDGHIRDTEETEGGANIANEGGDDQEMEQPEENFEAESLRRRRIEFLERNAQN